MNTFLNRGKKKSVAIGITLAVILIAIAGKAVFKKNEIPELPVLGSIPEFNLISDENKPFMRSDLKGQVWIADFIFTRCAGICPMMSSRMAELQKELKGSGVKLVSFSVDPEYDQPAILQIYRGRYQADPARWYFLTGDKKTIFALSSQHFHLGVQDIPEAERRAMEDRVGHSSKFVLVDAEARIRGYYASEEPGSLKKLARDARALEKLL